MTLAANKESQCKPTEGFGVRGQPQEVLHEDEELEEHGKVKNEVGVGASRQRQSPIKSHQILVRAVTVKG